METPVIIYLIATCVITSLLWYSYVLKQNARHKILENTYKNLQDNLDKEVYIKTSAQASGLQETIARLKSEIIEAKHQSFQDGYEKGRSEFSVKIRPYRNEKREGRKGWFVNRLVHKVELGYTCQVFVQGFPVLNPAVVIQETLEAKKKEVDFRKINNMIREINDSLRLQAANSDNLLDFSVSGDK